MKLETRWLIKMMNVIVVSLSSSCRIAVVVLAMNDNTFREERRMEERERRALAEERITMVQRERWDIGGILKNHDESQRARPTTWTDIPVIVSQSETYANKCQVPMENRYLIVRWVVKAVSVSKLGGSRLVCCSSSGTRRQHSGGSSAVISHSGIPSLTCRQPRQFPRSTKGAISPPKSPIVFPLFSFLVVLGPSVRFVWSSGRRDGQRRLWAQGS
jgi:hypothetical protein